ELEVLVKDGKEYLPATDVATTLEYTKPHKAVTDHCDEDGALTWGVIDRLGRKQQKKFITIGNVSRLIIAASRQSKNPLIKEKAKQYERWVFDEVIPSIHKHGAYMTSQTINALLQDPDLIIGLASQLKEEQQARRLAERTIEKQKPKVLFAEALEVSETSILVGELSKLMKQNGIPIGQNKLFEWLRENGYLCKKKGEMYNLPTEYSMDLKLFEIKKRTVNNPDGSLRTTRTPKVTGKGQVYFINKFLNENQTA
ncbi:phage antirepressor, partial [Bacillus cereus]|uniref:phage antirepressor n=1 Tax=Bacillus cereus TaxID=1396 RepID=UPI000BFC78A4